MKHSYVLFVAILALACSNKPTPSLDSAKAKVLAQNEKLHQVVATKNVNLLKEVYDEKAYFLAPGLGPITGRDSIIAMWSDGLENIVKMHSEPIEINGTEDILYEVGIVTNTIKTGTKDSVVVYKAKYNNVWKRNNNGEYRLVVDIWNKLP